VDEQQIVEQYAKAKAFKAEAERLEKEGEVHSEGDGMTRVAIIADSHFDESSRFDECCEIHEWIARDVALRDVDLVLHSGDVFERKSTPRERLAVRDWLRQVTEHAPVCMVRGNHDAPRDLALFDALETRCPIRVVEGAELVSFGGFDCGRGIDVACMAWPRKAELLSRLGDVSDEQGDQIAVNELRNVLRGLGVQRAPEPLERPLIFLGHVQTRASRVSTGQPLVGCDFELGLEDLALVGADFYALGHVHLGQEWTIDDAPVVYPGSPRRTAFGETEPKGYVVADFDQGRLVGWERVETPARQMILLEASWNGETLELR